MIKPTCRRIAALGAALAMALTFREAQAAVPADAGKVPVAGFTINPSPEWIHTTPCTEMQPGSALDFSSFGYADGPCGKYGWLVAKEENFEFEKRPGVPVRFMGVNFCCEGNTLPKEDSKRLIRNLVRLGYNTVRVHHHDNYIIRRSGSYTDTGTPRSSVRTGRSPQPRRLAQA